MKYLDILDNKISFNHNIIGLTNELKAMLIGKVFFEYKKDIVVVTPNLDISDYFYQMISKYVKNSLIYPVDDSIILDSLTESPDLKTKRLNTLNSLLDAQPKIIVTNLTGLIKKMPSKAEYLNEIINLEVSKHFAISDLAKRLVNNGYMRSDFVETSGQFALRGFVLDVYPTNLDYPIRVEFWGDTIESIREFDLNTQRTINKINIVEIITNTENKHSSLNSNTSTLIDYFKDPIVVYINYEKIEQNLDNLITKNYENYDQMTKLYFDFEAIDQINALNNRRIYLSDFDTKISTISGTASYNSRQLSQVEIDKIKNENKSNLNKSIDKTIIYCFNDQNKINIESNAIRNSIIISDENHIIPGKINLLLKSITDSFVINNVYVISENNYYGKKKQQTHYKSNIKMGKTIKNINKINIGDYVVHNSHGIGRYVGIKNITKAGIEKEYLQINYRGNDKIYLPVEKIEVIVKYSSTDDIAPKLNSLSGSDWIKTKSLARHRAESIASELLEIYTKRSVSKGFSFPKDDENQLNFENDFPFVETEDQLKVIEEIKQDMQSDKPMNRLLCGDVGFGKTEVAFRAMFKAVMGGKQVMLLCPTTLLSRQHYENAIERFKSFPINIGLLNRFISGKNEENTINKCQNGGLDIVIGTHRLLSGDVKFKDLGLLVIDEEQRFGVKHKEIINNIKESVDVLTLSATPIPRTIQLAMAGIRSLSLIETPPIDRHPIQTYVLAENQEVMKDAIEREVSRGGQVFMLYNNIEKMPSKLVELKKMLPDLRVAMAHGRMGKTEIENIMNHFLDGEYDLLLCTTIIETGIDIPSVNTLIIIDADHYGLSQLYQIRGRVGRSDKIAFSYLMYDKHKQLNDVAIKRLEAIKNFTELGSGFSIAMRDLSIRGAGDLLGKEQSGFIDSVGMTMFITMLSNEVKKLQGIYVEEEDESQPLLNVKTSIDKKYADDAEVKINIHKKINEITSMESLLKIKSELEDRFGKIDSDLLIYMYQELFDNLAKKHQITNIKQTANSIEITLDKKMTNTINGESLFIGLSEISRMFRVALKYNRLVITLDTIKLDKHFVYYLIEMIEVIEKSLKWVYI